MARSCDNRYVELYLYLRLTMLTIEYERDGVVAKLMNVSNAYFKCLGFNVKHMYLSNNPLRLMVDGKPYYDTISWHGAASSAAGAWLKQRGWRRVNGSSDNGDSSTVLGHVVSNDDVDEEN